MIISILNNSPDIQHSAYCFSNDLQYVAVLSNNAIINCIDSFDYEKVSDFLLNENWRQPQEESNGS